MEGDEILVWADAGRDDGVKEVFLQGWKLNGGEGFASGGRGNNSDELEVGQGGSRNVDSLGV